MTAAPGMSRLRLGTQRSWSVVLGSAALVSFAAMFPLCLPAGQFANAIIAAVIGLPCAGVGFVVSRRQPGNPLGWLFLVIGVCQFLGTDGGGYAWLSYGLGHHWPLGPVALALDQLWGPSLALFGVVGLLFPDGRLPSRFWRWILRAYGILFAAELVATAVAVADALAAHPVRVDNTGGLTAVDRPTGWFNTVQGPLTGAVLILSLIFIARQVLSWRRSAGERRQQLKWLASGAAVTIACLFLGGTWGSTPGHLTVLVIVGNIAWLGVAALPVSIGVAILKYRLYEIDRLISRTLSYTIVTGLLVGLYAGLVLLATEVLEVRGPVSVAAATLVAAALSAPVRRRVQHLVDRRFNRARYDAERTVAAFAARLQDTVNPDSVRADLSATVHAALEPAHVSVWLSR